MWYFVAYSDSNVTNAIVIEWCNGPDDSRQQVRASYGNGVIFHQ
jgi:hypothetical protein